jgi:hypothetical protein
MFRAYPGDLHHDGLGSQILVMLVARVAPLDAVSHVAIVARVTVKEGKADEYVAAFSPLPEQAEKEPGTLLYAVHRSQ